MIYPAHILADGSAIQSVQEHNRNTAQIAAACLEWANLTQTGYFAGLLHDMGKFTTQFKDYLEQSIDGKPIQPGSVIHTFGSARLILELFHDPNTCLSMSDMTAELLAYAAAAHHGLFDCVDELHSCGFSHRLSWDEEFYQEAKAQFFEQCADENELKGVFEQAHQELIPIYNSINQQSCSNEEIFFYLGLLARLLLAAVVEGDRQDTVRFMEQNGQNKEEKTTLALWSGLLGKLETWLKHLPAETPVQKARRDISEHCGAAANTSGGIFRLNTPTGSGKTISAFRFALSQAAKHNKSRIIFAFPQAGFASENLTVLKNIIGNQDLITEHYSDMKPAEIKEETVGYSEFTAQVWSAPIVMTTLKQLLNVLFSGEMACVRRFQSLCGSVLIIDEPQMVPANMASLFNLAIQFLSKVCGVAVVLSSATLPSHEYSAHPIKESIIDLVPYSPNFEVVFRRTLLLDAGAKRLQEVPEFLMEKLRYKSSVLVICNLEEQALMLYEKLKASNLSCFYLATIASPAEYQDTVRRIKLALQKSRENGLKVLCIATQSIESCANLSFACVVRFMAGMDNAIQAAGLCNREGEFPSPAPVFLLSCSDENSGSVSGLQNAKTASLQLLFSFHRQPAHFENSLSSPAALSFYFQCLYGGMRTGTQDGTLKDGRTMLDLLSVNGACSNGMQPWGRFGLHQAFALAGRKFCELMS